MSPLLFVYGTLLPDSTHPLAQRLARESEDLGPAEAPGLLYDLGGYPGLRHLPGAPQRVRGRLLALHRPAHSLAWLDAYEGCSARDPRPHEYRRQRIRVDTPHGPRQAWAYLWQGRRGRVIAGGDWLTRQPAGAT